jgi:hypothetical protein
MPKMRKAIHYFRPVRPLNPTSRTDRQVCFGQNGEAACLESVDGTPEVTGS